MPIPMRAAPRLTTTVALAVVAGAAYAPAAAQAPAHLAGRDYAAADVRFMSGMIYHHAQAVLIAGWAPSHVASASLSALCERIVVGQGDEIALMRRWLGDRHEDVPDANPAHSMMPGMNPATMMPGMLSAEQLARLDVVRRVRDRRPHAHLPVVLLPQADACLRSGRSGRALLELAHDVEGRGQSGEARGAREERA